MVEIPQDIRCRLDELAQTFHDSEVYQRYERCSRELMKNPEVFEKMNRFRKENFALNTKGGSGSGMEPEVRSMLLDRFSVHPNPLIGEYLDAELEMCLVLREMLARIGTLADLKLDAFSSEDGSGLL